MLKKIMAVAVSLALLLVLTSCGNPPAWTDDFSGASLAPFDATHWYTNRWFAPEASCANPATSGEKAAYKGLNNLYVRQTGFGWGELVARKDGACPGFPWTSGWAQSGGSRASDGTEKAPQYVFTFGRVDVSARIQASKDSWPAIWLLAPGTKDANGHYPYPSCPEIDILENHGETPTEADQNFHFDVNGACNDTSGHNEYFGAGELSTGFHTFSIDWTSTKLEWFVDGVSTWVYTGPGIPQQPMYLILNEAIDGANGGPDPSLTKATFAINQVKVTPH